MPVETTASINASCAMACSASFTPNPLPRYSVLWHCHKANHFRYGLWFPVVAPSHRLTPHPHTAHVLYCAALQYEALMDRLLEGMPAVLGMDDFVVHMPKLLKFLDFMAAVLQPFAAPPSGAGRVPAASTTGLEDAAIPDDATWTFAELAQQTGMSQSQLKVGSSSTTEGSPGVDARTQPPPPLFYVSHAPTFLCVASTAAATFSQGLHKKFKQLDADNSNSLGLAEFDDIMNDAPIAKYVFKAFDKDGSGALGFPELGAWLTMLGCCTSVWQLTPVPPCYMLLIQLVLWPFPMPLLKLVLGCTVSHWRRIRVADDSIWRLCDIKLTVACVPTPCSCVPAPCSCLPPCPSSTSTVNAFDEDQSGDVSVDEARAVVATIVPAAAQAGSDEYAFVEHLVAVTGGGDAEKMCTAMAALTPYAGTLKAFSQFFGAPNGIDLEKKVRQAP